MFLNFLSSNLITETIVCHFVEVGPAHYETDEALKAQKYEVLVAETIPFFLKKLEARAAANNGYMALGKVISY